MAGWIKLHRSILEKGWIKKPEYVQLWVVLLLMASHENREYFWNGKTVKLKSGQLITGRKALSEKTGISQTTIERILKCFESEHQIGQQKTSTSRLISILNWSKHQQVGQQSGQQTDNGRTTDGQRTDTNKELKNGNNDKNLRKMVFDQFWDLYDKKKGKEKCEKYWDKITEEEVNLMFIHIPLYKKAQPNKQFRKDPYSYLYNKSWNDEIIDRNPIKSPNQTIFKNEQELADFLNVTPDPDNY